MSDNITCNFLDLLLRSDKRLWALNPLNMPLWFFACSTVDTSSSYWFTSIFSLIKYNFKIQVLQIEFRSDFIHYVLFLYVSSTSSQVHITIVSQRVIHMVFLKGKHKVMYHSCNYTFFDHSLQYGRCVKNWKYRIYSFMLCIVYILFNIIF